MLDTKLFENLPEPELRRLVATARRRVFRRNEVVFHGGDPADTLHLIARGRFASKVTTQFGDMVTVAVQGPGEAFGELALVEVAASRSTSVVALEPGETWAVGRDDFTRLRKQYPAVNDVLVRLMAQRLRRQSELLVEALFVPAETRVLRRLCELAALSGTSRATVNRILRAEAKRGTVRLTRGKTAVLDLDSLAARAARG
jgi:CRP-like cAMP-binding protein